jgi:FMN phosphatase YigB (HAD superfamily)
MKVKTISFDLWATLIKANPEYKKQRVEYLLQYTDKSVDDIHRIMTKIKTDIDSRVEKYGIQYDDNELYKLLLSSLDIPATKLNFKDYIAFCHSSSVSNPPLLLPYTANVLETLKAKDYRMLIASNTLFTSGKVMRIILMKLGIFDYFHECIFSDEVGFSKPHIEFFKQIHQKSHTFSENILHTGDNSVTDMNGARNYGMQIFFAPDGFATQQTVTDLLNVLNK